MFAKILAFLSPVAGSVKGFINAEELFRAVLTAVAASVGTGSVASILTAVLTTISASAATIFAGPAIPLATFGIGLVLELLRRKTQGATGPVVIKSASVSPVVPK